MSKDRVREGILGAVPLRVIEGGAGDQPKRGGGGGGNRGRSAGAADTPPVLPLGHDEEGVFFFLNPAGFRRALNARELVSRGGISGLFGGDVAWLKEHFPKKFTRKTTDESGGESSEEVTVDYRPAPAGEHLMKLCFKAGGYDPSKPIRRPGIWRGRDGAPVVHVGDYVLIGDIWRRAGFRDPVTGVIWAGTVDRHPAPCGRGPDGEPRAVTEASMAGVEIARRLQADIRELWRLEKPGGEFVALGWLGTAMYGAATNWRPNVFFTGGAGSGKSQLTTLLAACCPMHILSTDTTKAGIESALNNTSMPAVLDESADRGDGRAAQNLVDVVLSASSGAGTMGLRGTADGRARAINVVTAVAMAAINAPELQPQHQARFSIVELCTPEAGIDHRAQMEAAIARARDAAPAIWLRVLLSWPRYQAALAAFRAALGRSGCAAREMDQYGALLAGWWVLTEDGLPDERSALEGVVALDAYVRRADEVEADGGPRRAVQFLASSMVQKDRSTDVETIGALVERAWDRGEGGDYAEDRGAAARWLERIGIRVIRADEPPDKWNKRPAPRGSFGDGLWLSRTHRFLATLFASQRGLQDGRWVQELKRLPGAVASAGGVRVQTGVPASTAIWLPRTAWDPDWRPPDKP